MYFSFEKPLETLLVTFFLAPTAFSESLETLFLTFFWAVPTRPDLLEALFVTFLLVWVVSTAISDHKLFTNN